MPKNARVIAVGLDAVSFRFLRWLMSRHDLPAFRHFFTRGAANPLLPAMPAWTPTNWATLMTGALPGTHSAVGWSVRAGDAELSTFDSRAITAETIFEAAARAGIRSAAIHYPATMPRRTEMELMIDGFGQPAYGSCPWEISPAQCYTNLDVPKAVSIQLSPASGWANAPSAAALLEAPVDIVPKAEGETLRLWLLLLNDGSGFSRALICQAKNASAPLADLRPGQWSQWLTLQLNGPSGPTEATVRFKLIELSPDASRLRLFRTQAFPVTGWTDPPDLGPKLIDTLGPYIEHASLVASTFGWVDENTDLELAAEQINWIARCFIHLCEDYDVRLAYCHWHLPDNAGHHLLARVDPTSPHYDPEKAPAAEQLIARVYSLADRALQKLLDWADDRTYIAVISDHGHAPDRWACDLNRRLAEVGLLKFEDEATGKVDRSASKAWGQNLTVTVNLQGRQPSGIVPPEDYEKIQQQIIDALLDWRAPDGSRVVALALPRQHAHIVGMWGDFIGDVFFVYNPGFAWGKPQNGSSVGEPGWYAAHHGPQIPTTETPISGIAGIFLISGPGIKAGYTRPEGLGFIRTADFVPTICRILEIEPPAHCQGAPAMDIFEGHEEVRQLRIEGPVPQQPARVWVQRDMHDFSPLDERGKQ